MAKEFMSIDGNTAAAHAAYAFTEVAGIYPITPSSSMAEQIDAWSNQNKKNLFNNVVQVTEMQSEAGAAGVVHGAIEAGALSSTYTSSQGLLLMVPTIYKLVGELRPAVIHVAARSVASKALSIFGDHQDIYAARQTGIPMLSSHSVQEVMDLAGVAHLSAIKASTAFMHFFDGFRTSHEIQKVEIMPYKVFDRLLDKKALAQFRANAMNPHTNPITRGGAENDDIYFQGREAQNQHFENVVEVVADYMEAISKETGRDYKPFTYYGHPKATTVIVAMGSVTETIKETIDSLNKAGGKYGVIKVHLYRPFSTKYLKNVVPKSVKNIAVLDRTKEMGAAGEPLYLDVVAALNGDGYNIIGGRYGLSSKDVDPAQIKAVFEHAAKQGHSNFTIGINDDVTKLSLPVDEKFYIKDSDYTSCLFFGLGSDGTVSANKNSIKIIGDNTDLYAQAYFAYDSKKAGGTTRSHLRFGPSPIRSTYYVKNIDFISCSLDSYLNKFNMLENLKDGGTFLLNTSYKEDEIIEHLPDAVKHQLASKNARLFIIDATEIAQDIGMGRRTNTILQSAFFALNENILPYKNAVKFMKEAAKKSYGKKGNDVVEANYKAIDRGKEGLVEIPVDPSWIELSPEYAKRVTGDEYFDNFVTPIARLEGYDLPVSTFAEDSLLLGGELRNGVAIKEKRNIAVQVPRWIEENCIQCNRCAYVCPHATIRPFLLNDEEVKNAPDGLVTLPAVGKGVEDLRFSIQVSQENCVGCSLCAVECPGKMGNKALEMVDVHEELPKVPISDYVYQKVSYKSDRYDTNFVKGSQFQKPYFEVSGACAGCGETPYYRLMTQFFGRDALIANATGCTSIYSASTPSTPFTVDENGEGPAWANSLFENDAEFGFGMKLAQNFKQKQIKGIIDDNIKDVEKDVKDVLKRYLDANTRDEQRVVRDELIAKVKSSKNKGIKGLLDLKNDLVEKSLWIVGGDGWSYDIGYGGLDHVMANNLDVNIMILDTEVYSNTGGQSSKSSQAASIAKFASGGKEAAKKDLAQIAMTYGHVYVAQVAMGANQGQVIKAMKEAESYPGPSVIIAYSPCIEHGIKGGLMNHQITQKKAVESGYFNIFRYDPRLELDGKNPLQLDSKEPNFDLYKEFLTTETRFSQLAKVNPENVDRLFEKSKTDAMRRYDRLKRLATETETADEIKLASKEVAEAKLAADAKDAPAHPERAADIQAPDTTGEMTKGDNTTPVDIPKKPEATAGKTDEKADKTPNEKVDEKTDKKTDETTK